MSFNTIASAILDCERTACNTEHHKVLSRMPTKIFYADSRSNDGPFT
jgi:hypothetical protein